jgi:hypothetical protein
MILIADSFTLRNPSGHALEEPSRIQFIQGSRQMTAQNHPYGDSQRYVHASMSIERADSVGGSRPILLCATV